MDARRKLFRIYWRIQSAVVPNLKYSQECYEDVLKLYTNPKVTWLDLGCGHHLLPPWRIKEEKKLIANCKAIVGLDFDLRSLKKHYTILDSNKVRGDVSHLPFRESSFDLITANMVVEHLRWPIIQFREIWRILKPEGLFLLHTPNVFGYTAILARLTPDVLRKKVIYIFQGRKEEDIFGTYYRANSPLKIRQISAVTGFNVVRIKMIVSGAQFVIVPPLAVLELLWIKVLMRRPFKLFRTNIIGILKKSSTVDQG